LDAEIQTIILGLQRSNTTPHDELESHFLSITVFYPKGRKVALLGTIIAQPPLNPAERTHLATGKSLLLTRECGTPVKNCLLVVHSVYPARAEDGLIAGVISADYLWDKETLPSSLDLSIFDGAMLLYGPKQSAPPKLDLAHERLGDPERWFEWKQGSVTYDAAYWRLLLAPQFHAAPWTIVVSRKHDEIAAPILQFRQTFLLVV